MFSYSFQIVQYFLVQIYVSALTVYRFNCVYFCNVFIYLLKIFKKQKEAESRESSKDKKEI